MVKFCTYNARGLGNFHKRKQVFTLLKQKKIDFVLIQESHACQRDEQLWRSQWGGQIFFANGASDSKGVLIMLRRGLAVEIGRTCRDDHGRYLISEYTIDGFSFLICNIYAPNVDSPEFFKKVEMEIEEFDNANIMVAGDFNFAINPQKDRKFSYHNNDKSRDTFLSFAEFKELVDVWRTMHPEAHQFSCCRSSQQGTKFSRLDMFFVSFGLMNCVSSSSMHTGYQSDHSFVICDINLSHSKHGPGYWKFNNSFLFDKSFVTAAKAILEEKLLEVDVEPGLRWEYVKGAFIQFSKQYGRDKAKDKNKQLYEIEVQLDRLKIMIEELPYEEDQDSFCIYNNLCAQRTELIKAKVNGIIVRSRERFFEEGERSSKYYFSLEKHNARKKTMFRAKDDNGSITSDQSQIRKIQAKYFKKLYSPDIRASFNLVNIHGNGLTQEMKTDLESDLKMEELTTAIKQMPNNKSPGLDGLTIEVYKMFWPLIKDVFFEAIISAKEKGILRKAMRLGVIALIPKKDKDLLQVGNWRPITMLTCDYKIVAKAFALRLQRVLPDIIHEDQTGFMKGRSISDNIRKTIEVVNHTHRNRIEFLIMTIDYQKCFDLIQHEALWGCLRYLNFGESFIHWIKLLYTQIELHTCNHGFLSETISVNRSILQGSPLAAFLFLTAGQILHDLIQYNSKIKGIKINDLELLISQFADDTTLFLTYERSVLEEVAKTFDRMHCLTGLKVNYDKTNIYRVGSLANTNAKIYTAKEFNWTNEPISLLGVLIPTKPDNKLSSEINYESIINRIDSITQSWSLRAPTLMGRVLIVNTLIASLFVYKWQVFPNMDTTLIQVVKSKISAFIWNNRRPKITPRLLTRDSKQGGLRLVDVELRQKALKIQWICKIENSIVWKSFFYGSLAVKINEIIWRCNLAPKHAHLVFNENADLFWIDVFRAWSSYNFVLNSTLDEFGQQVIWYNSLVLIEDKPFLYNKALENGILYVKDFMIENQIMSFQDFTQKYGVCLNWLEFRQITTALAKPLNDNICDIQNSVDNPLYISIDTLLTYDKISNMVYNVLIFDKKALSRRLARWERKLKETIELTDFCNLFNNIRKLTICTKYRNFQYRLLTGTIVTNRLLKLWGLIDQEFCSFCNGEVEDDIHLFYSCSKVQPVWNELRDYILSNMKSNIDRDLQWNMYSIMFSLVHPNPSSVINFLVTVAKQFIYKSRCLRTPLNPRLLISEIEEIYRMELNIATRRSRLRQHIGKWSCIKEIEYDDNDYIASYLQDL